MPDRTRRRIWPWVLLGVFGLLIFAAIADNVGRESPDPVPVAPTVNVDTMEERDPAVFTYFFYWYDAETGAHLEPGSGQPVTLPPDPPPSWRSVEWFRKELVDMAHAGIDIVLPVYWGSEEPWSLEGLPHLAEARRQMAEGGEDAPSIGLFFDTTIIGGRDLTSTEGKAFLYDQTRLFFERIPRDFWGLIDGRPVIWLYFAFFASAFDQSTFDFLYDSFERNFGVRPYIVREVSWDFAIADDGGRLVLEDQPIATDANYKWGAALEGYFERGSVAAVGPGFDEREIPGRGRAHQPREDGRFYRENFERAIDSGKPLLVIETWNEVHEASGIGETLEYGREYIDLTGELVERYKAALSD